MLLSYSLILIPCQKLNIALVDDYGLLYPGSSERVLVFFIACWQQRAHLQAMPSSMERFGSWPWARWVRTLQRERRSHRQAAISPYSFWVSRAPTGSKPRPLGASSPWRRSCSVRLCSISSWFCAESWNTNTCTPSVLLCAIKTQRAEYALRSTSNLFHSSA